MPTLRRILPLSFALLFVTAAACECGGSSGDAGPDAGVAELEEDGGPVVDAGGDDAGRTDGGPRDSGVDAGDIGIDAGTDAGPDDDDAGPDDDDAGPDDAGGALADAGELPPDPADVAPPNDRTVATNHASSVRFLWEGPSPIQTDVVAGAIDDARVSVVRGRVLDRDGEPLPGVRIEVLNQPDLGRTLSRLDGVFDLAVNGGGTVTLTYTREGFLGAQRQVMTPRLGWAELDDVVLVALDPVVTEIVLGSGEPLQVARGSVSSDDDGERRGTVLVPSGTAAELVLPDGTIQSLSSMHVRATEYTVGDRGPQAMPAVLPPTSGYTYAIELSLDEALAAGATEVRFDRPLPFYVENFLGFPVGGRVPVGYYDRERAAWVPSADGRVIEVVAIVDGLATLDVDGDGAGDDSVALASLGVDEDERRTVATLYAVGATLWRVPMTHFTPWDCNWPRGPSPGATTPGQPRPYLTVFDDDDDCVEDGSVVECASQILGEQLGLPGTQYSLVYRSDRVPGRRGRLQVPLTGEVLPPSLLSVEAHVQLAGQMTRHTLNPTPNLSLDIAWDGRDRFGREVLGGAAGSVVIRYAYPAVYYEPGDFEASFAGLPTTAIVADRARNLVYLEQRHLLGAEGAPRRWDARGTGIGGWTLDVHHVYDPGSATLFRGDGSRRVARNTNVDRVIERFAGQQTRGYSGDNGKATDALLNDPQALTVGPDGSLYIGDYGNSVIRRVRPDGTIETVAGNGVNDHPIDGALAVSSPMGGAGGMDIGPDGSLYFLDADYGLLMRVDPEGVLHRVAGQYDLFCELSEDEAVALDTGLCVSIWSGLAVAPDGTVFFADTNANRVVSISPDGVLRRIAGDAAGLDGFAGDGGPALASLMSLPQGLALGSDGSIYIADTFNDRLRRIGVDGIIATVAGGGSGGALGGAATEYTLDTPYDVAIDDDGALYMAGGSSVYKIGGDGIITQLAGAAGVQPSFSVDSDDGGPAIGTYFGFVEAIAVSKGLVYVNDFDDNIWQVRASKPRGDADEIIIPSDDGSELYLFDRLGRHQETLHGLTQGSLRTFAYDDAGYLVSVIDGDGNSTTIERDESGFAVAIVGPFGARTALGTSDAGFLTQVVSPAGEIVDMSYDDGGLLTSLTDPAGYTHTYAYDASGRLISDEGPLGGAVTLVASDAEAGRVRLVAVTTAEGDTTTFVSGRSSEEDGVREVLFPDGTSSRAVTRGAQATLELPDGRDVIEVIGADPRWRLQSPFVRHREYTWPSGASVVSTFSREVTLDDPNDPFSLAQQTVTATVNGRSASWVFDADTRTVARNFVEGQVISDVLDAQGRLAARSRAGLATTTISRDAQGRISAVQRGARLSTRAYGPSGYLSSVEDPSGAVTTYGRDANGRLTAVSTDEGRTLGFDHDAAGAITSVTTPSGPVHTWTRTAFGLPSSYLAPGAAAGTTMYEYRADRLLDEVTFADGRVMSYRYDANRRLTGLSLARGEIVLMYDENTGQLHSSYDPSGVTTTFAHDGDLVTSLALSGPVSSTLTIVYDAELDVASRALGGDVVNYAYDGDKRLLAAGALTLTRSPSTGFVTDVSVADGAGAVSEALTYSPWAELASQAVDDAGGGSLYDSSYSYDSAGRISAVSESIGGVTIDRNYRYDGDGRLLEVREDDVVIEELVWDANGNLSSRTRGAQVDIGSYAEDDRVLTFGDTSYTHSAAGHLVSRVRGGTATTLYEHDERGSLLAVTLDDGRELEYVMDAHGRRVGKLIDGALVQGFVYDEHGRLIAELDDAGTQVSRFVYGARRGAPALMVRGGGLYRIVSDVRGSPRLVIEVASGVIAQRIDYDAFGAVVLDTSPGLIPFGFGGGLYDRDSGLVKLGRRDYDAETGRFTSKDPLGFQGEDWNLYRYAKSDPVSMVDPDGTLAFLTVALIAAGVAAAAAKLANWNEERKLLETELAQTEAVAGRINDAFAEGDYDYLDNFTAEEIAELQELPRRARQRCRGNAAEVAKNIPGSTLSGPPPSAAMDVVGDAVKDGIFAAGDALDSR